MDESEQLKSTYERNGKLAGWSGQAIVVGLALDIVVLLLFAAEKSWKETVAGIFATFVIAAGVWLEIHFGHKAEAAAFRLQQLSEERVAESEARSAEANARALQAQVALERYKAPRTISPEARAHILGKVASFPRLAFDVTINPGPESQNFMLQVGSVLQAAGWIWKPRKATGFLAINATGIPQVAVHTGIVGFGLEIASSRMDDWMPVLLALRDAFIDESIDMRINVASDEHPDSELVHLFIGSKQ